jgi:uncharacterized protein YfaS (alpha-2-macroglobulin family)
MPATPLTLALRTAGLVLALCAQVPALPAAAQDTGSPVPERRMVYQQDTDLFGGDIRSLFDTTLDICERACIEEATCTALTFNIANTACFLKGGDVPAEPFADALSARIRVTRPDVVATARSRAAELDFLSAGEVAAAAGFASSLGAQYPANGQTAEALNADAATLESASGPNRQVLIRRLAALTLSDAPGDWSAAAATALALTGEDQAFGRAVAMPLALNAYLRAAAAADRTLSLDLMAQALETGGNGKDAIAALRLSSSIAPSPETTAALDRLVGLYGFRIAEHAVEADAALPRLCATFTEPLAADTDFAPFVSVEGASLPVEASEQQLCVDGLLHGETYRVTFRSGLPAASGEVMGAPVTIEAYVRDRTPSVRATSQGYVLPPGPGLAIPFVTVNASELDLRLYRVGERNLRTVLSNGVFGTQGDSYTLSWVETELGQAVWQGKGQVAGSTLNVDATTLMPLAEALGTPEPGAYVLAATIDAADPDQPWAAQWFVVSDLGVTALSGDDGLNLIVRGLSDAGPKAGITADLVAVNNSILATATTDADGRARFDAGLLRGAGGAAPAMVTLTDGAADFAFLDLTRSAFDLSDRGVEGRAAPPPVDVFLSTERGAYRPRETVHATILARDAQAGAVADLPLTAIVTRADGVEFLRTVIADQGAGGRSLSFDLPATATRGTWRLRIHADPEAPPLADRTFLVEDFVPEKIDFEARLPDGALTPSADTLADIRARYLYGAPGAGLVVEGEVRLTPVRRLDAWPGVTFGMEGEAQEPLQSYFGPVETDANGVASLPLLWPELAPGTGLYRAEAIFRAREGSGRPVERIVTRDLAPDGPRIGIRPLFDGVAAEGSTAGFEVLAIGPDLAATGIGEVTWTLERVHRSWQWYQIDGSWNYEPVTRRERIANGSGPVTAGAPLPVEGRVDWGQYELKVISTDRPDIRASLAFSAGWYAAEAGADTPDVLQVGLDRPAYAPGDQAELRITARAAGTALVQVLAEGLVDFRAVPVQAGDTVVSLPVTDAWRPGAYVTATLIHPLGGAAEAQASVPAPTRSIGLAWAGIDPGPQRLDASIDMPGEASPRQPLTLAVRVDGAQPGETVHATLAAVDVGVLNVTGFKSPDPLGHYFGQRRLGVDIRDLYGRLIDSRTGSLGQVRSGGDGSAASAAPPPTEDLVAFFSGTLTVGPDGLATASYDVPDFNGTVRVMAIVWSATAIGQAEKDVIIRDRVVVSAALPRFVAPGDAARLRLDLAHVAGPPGDVSVAIAAEGPVRLGQAPQSVTLGEGQRATLTVPVTGTAPGDARLTVVTTTPDGTVLTKRLTLAVRATDPELARQTRLTLNAAGGSLQLGPDLFAGLAPGARATLALGPLARFDVPGLLTALDGYPYGCTEQITAQALPLIYFDQVAEATGIGLKADIASRIEGAITSVLANQTAEGSFGLWYPSSGDLWLDAFVTDFLSRAGEAGHAVPQRPFDQALANLKNQVAYAADFEQGGEGIAYALMVLARHGRAAIGDLRYFADTRADNFATPLALAQLGTALSYYADQPRADAMFARASARLAEAADDSLFRADYGSGLRDAAAVLTLASEAKSTAIDRDRLSDIVAGGARQPWRSTQEMLWTLLAAREQIDAIADGGVTFGGQLVTGPLVQAITAGSLATPVDVVNLTDAPLDAVVTAYGIPTEPEPAQGNGYRIERWLYTMDGQPVPPEGVAQNTRLVAIVRVTPEREAQGRLMVSDPLPAGLEIDNPNLLRAGDIAQLDWLSMDDVAQHTEFRSDRFLAAVDWSGSSSFQLAYMVRAVTPGTFHVPAASVEDMYRPGYRARTDTGTLTVLAAE